MCTTHEVLCPRMKIKFAHQHETMAQTEIVLVEKEWICCKNLISQLASNFCQTYIMWEKDCNQLKNIEPRYNIENAALKIVHCG